MTGPFYHVMGKSTLVPLSKLTAQDVAIPSSVGIVSAQGLTEAQAWDVYAHQRLTDVSVPPEDMARVWRQIAAAMQAKRWLAQAQAALDKGPFPPPETVAPNDEAAGLVPLPKREPPARVVPPLPFSCYAVMTGLAKE
jgi:hypothetical protein